MKDQGESTKQLMNELVELRQQNAELEKSGIKHKQGEELLEESQEKYKAFFDRSLCCICMHDLEGRFLDVNKAALNLLKYTKKELTSLSLFSLIEEDQLPDAYKTFKEIKQTGSQKKHSEYKFRKKRWKLCLGGNRSLRNLQRWKALCDSIDWERHNPA